MAGPRGVLSTAVLLMAVGSAVAGCGGNPATDFCSSYGDAMHGLVVAARQYGANPANFSATYKSTMDSLGSVRTKAPDDKLRSAFDRSMFTFSVFDTEASLADLLSRADFSTNAVVLTCAEYGLDVTV
ncbi:MAG TPA: hypothetical protein VFV67_36205 [Actinophytocola sp.]|uniref:hypothetical protein n=1 Tax=Actinophytocola sp. TaxID=1872138 RepID=UPI002DC00A0D|nr:hypothetical protein [Actinophytocola sp.]HEU5476101.1 hypothetical protein [Actinophytocola sp.]